MNKLIAIGCLVLVLTGLTIHAEPGQDASGRQVSRIVFNLDSVRELATEVKGIVN